MFCAALVIPPAVVSQGYDPLLGEISVIWCCMENPCLCITLLYARSDLHASFIWDWANLCTALQNKLMLYNRQEINTQLYILGQNVSQGEMWAMYIRGVTVPSKYIPVDVIRRL